MISLKGRDKYPVVSEVFEHAYSHEQTVQRHVEYIAVIVPKMKW